MFRSKISKIHVIKKQLDVHDRLIVKEFVRGRSIIHVYTLLLPF